MAAPAVAERYGMDPEELGALDRNLAVEILGQTIRKFKSRCGPSPTHQRFPVQATVRFSEALKTMLTHAGRRQPVMVQVRIEAQVILGECQERDRGSVLVSVDYDPVTGKVSVRV